jgi:tape measure domain-containing protein
VADKELPPLYVKILGDASGFTKTIAETLAAATEAGEAVARSKDAEFEREFTNYMLLQKSKDIGVANVISNIDLLRKIEDAKFNKEFNNEVLLEKQRELRKIMAEAEFEREFSNLVLLEKQRAFADDKRIKNEILLQKIKDQDFNKELLNEILLQKQKDLAEAREFQNELLLEKQREASRRAAEADRIDELKWNSKLLEDKMKADEAEKKAAIDRYLDSVKWNSKLLEDQMRADEAAKKLSHANYIDELKWNSKLLEDKMKADEAAKQSAIDKYLADVKWNSKLLEDQMKADDAAKKSSHDKYIEDLKWNSKLLEDKMKADEAAKKSAEAKRIADLKWNSKLLEDQMKADEAEKKSAHDKYIADLKWNSKLLEDKMKADEAAKQSAIDKYLADLKWNSKLLEDQMKAEERRVAEHEKTINKMVADVRRYEEEQAQAANRTYLRDLKFNSKILEDEMKSAKRAADAKIREEARAARERERLARRSTGGGGGSGLGGGLTSRADIYMHTNAIQSIMRHSKSMVELYSEYTQAKAGLEAFAGSAQKTDEIMKDMRDFAQKTPYSLADLTQETKNMMARGMAADDATESIKRLGAVAGGDVNRLSHLALAFAQISTKGKLMQQDLNQLTEQGFNPLLTIAERSLKPNQTLEQRMAELTQAKEDGLITSKHVMDALRVETSLGGRYAELLNKMSGEVGGLAARLREMFDEIKLDAMKLLDEEMKNALKTAIYYVGMLKQWISDNQETAKSIIEAAVAAGKGVIAFHLLGLAVAAMRWWMTSAVATITAFRFVMLPLVGLTYLFGIALAFSNAMLAAFRFGMLVANALTGMYALYVLGATTATNGWTVSTLINSAATRAAGIATYFWNGALLVVRAGLLGVQIAAAKAWIVFLGPISFIVGAVALVIAVIWNLVDVIFNGLGGSFGRVWESMKSFFVGAYGFFMNFGDNIRVLAKYVYENWQSLFSDMFKIVGGFVMSVPGNILVMWRMGMRLTVAFGAWLISYLPSAIYNAFAEGFKFVKTLFSQLLDAGKSVWEFITSPSKWASGAGAVMDFITKIGDDTKNVAENGFVDTATKIIDEERKNLSTGLEGVALSSPSIEGLKFNAPETEKPKAPEPDKLPTPEAFNPDFSGLDNVGAGKGKGGGYKAQDAISVQSGDYTKKMAEYMDQVRGMKAATSDPKLQAQQKANQLLQRIEKNTAKQGPTVQTVDL